MTTDDRPYDPSASAADTLRDLGYVPGPQPVRQLRQVAEEELADASAAPDVGSTGAGTRLLEAAVAGLSVLGGGDLDELEQQHLAEVFGLPEPDRG